MIIIDFQKKAMAIEQAALSEKTPGDRRIRVFAWYNLVGSFATALGALAGGGLAQALQGHGFTPFDSYRLVVVGYAVIGAAMVLLFLGLSPSVEPPRVMRVAEKPAWFEPDLGLHWVSSSLSLPGCFFYISKVGTDSENARQR